MSKKNKAQLQQEAKELGLPIKLEDGKELTKAQLQEIIDDFNNPKEEISKEPETLKEDPLIELAPQEEIIVVEPVAVPSAEYPQLKRQLKHYRDKCVQFEASQKSSVSLAKHEAVLKKVRVLQESIKAKDAEITKLKKQK